jgi:hypothetical protein
LRPHLVPSGEEEKIEKYGLDDGRNLDVELTYENPGQQASNDNAEAKTAEPESTDEKPDRDCQKDGQLGILT